MLTVEEIANLVGGKIVRGDGAQKLDAVCPLDNATPQSLSFVTKAKYLDHLVDTKAAAVLLSKEMLEKAGTAIVAGLTLVQVEHPYLGFARVAQVFARRTPRPEGIHESAVIDARAVIGKDVSIGPFVYVGPGASVAEAAVLYPGVHVQEDAKVGAGSVLYNHVVLRHGCSVGERCIIHPGVVIGSDGFGFAQDHGGDPKDLSKLQHVKIPQVGDAVIEDDVEIGANSCVDRGALGTTRIMSGTKIDNLVQIGHNVQVGKNCIIVAQAGLAGSSRLKDAVTVAAQVGVVGHIEVGEGALIYGQSGVTQDVPAGEKVMGTPAIPARTFFRSSVYFGQLGKLMSRVKQLEKKMKSED